MHRIFSFKGFEDARIDLFVPFVLLIGRNGSGKSNLIEGVELLARLAHGTPLPEITDVHTSAGQLQVRGGLAGCASPGKPSIELGFEASFSNRVERFGVEYRLRINVEGSPQIEAESFCYTDRTSGKLRVFFETVPDPMQQRAGGVKVRYDNFARGGNKPSVLARADRTVISQLPGLVRPTPKNKTALRLVANLKEHLSAALVFDPAPRAMRSYVRIGQRTLLRDGSNLSSVLHALSTGSNADQEALARIVAVLRQLPEEPFDEIGFVTTALSDVMLGFRGRGSQSLLDARLLSDGTLRALAILAALETAKEGSRVVVEEVDNGVHPTRVGVLLRSMTEAGERRGLNVLCTTHNSALLDALTGPQIRSVVVCHRDASGAGKLTRIEDLVSTGELLAGSHLGDLVTRGVIEKHLAPDASKMRREAVERWLERLP